MKQRTALSVLPLLLLTAPALAQAPAAPAAPEAPVAAPAPVVAEPAPVVGPVPPPAGEAVPAAATPPPAAVEPPQEGAPPDKVTISKTGFFQPSLNLQAWAVAEHIGNARTDENAWQTSFRIRRAEVKAKGEIIPKKVGYMVMFDPARLLDFKPASTDVKDADGATIGTVPVVGPPGAQNGSTVITGASSSILQDVQLTFITDYADFSIGQFKIPVSLEGAGSASKLYLPERSLVARRFGDRRDIGFKVEKKFDKFSYWFGVYNGEGQNNLDSNDQKDLALRVEVYPIKELTLAAVGYVSVGDRDLVNTKDRIEGDIKFEKYGILLQGEAIRGWDMVGTAAAHRRISGQGFYVLAGYTLFDNLQPVVRIGAVDPEVGADEHGDPDVKAVAPLDEMTAYEFGVNYYLKQHDAKLQLAGSFFDPEQRAAKTTFDLILAAQVAF
ncbi:MAG: hypothetical protein EOO73_13270 [Myxococcales bacterium]|nr:MAG: hypothetical protein EOO73_13270 [Myxococcales bacterium]